MRKKPVLWLVVPAALAVVLLAAASSWGALANDDVGSAQTISVLPSTFSLDTTGATLQTGEPQPCAGIGSTVWYAYTADVERSLTAETYGSLYDTVAAVYSGPNPSFSALTLLGCNDDSAGTLQSRVNFHTTPGQTYWIQVGGFFGATGSLTFTLGHWPNTTISDPVVVPRLRYTDHSEEGGDFSPEPGEPTPSCVTSIWQTTWYRFTDPVGGRLIADTVGTTFDTILAVYEPGRLTGSFTEVGCNDNAIGSNISSFDITTAAGTTYWFQLGRHWGTDGTRVFHLDRPQDLVTTKSASRSIVSAGNPVLYRIQIANPNPVNVTLGDLRDTLPTGFSYIAGSSNLAGSGAYADPAISGQTLTWAGPLVVPGFAGQGLLPYFEFEFAATVASVIGEYCNSAQATPPSGYTVQPALNTACVTVVLPLRASKAADAPTVGVGDRTGYTITIDNPNTTAVPLRSIVDDLPPGFSYAGPTSGETTADPFVQQVSGRDRLTWQGAFSVPAQNSIFVHFDVIAAAYPGRFTNDAGAETGAPCGPSAVSGCRPSPFVVTPALGTAPVDVTAQDVVVTKTASRAKVPPLGPVRYAIAIGNPNAVDLILNQIVDVAPAGFSYVAGSTTGATTADPSVSGSSLVWSGPFTVTARGRISLSFVLTAASRPGLYFNAASAQPQAPWVTIRPTGDTAPVWVVAPLTTAKTADQPSSKVGETNGYSITLTNPNPVDALVDSITDTLPAGFGYMARSTTGATTDDPSVAGDKLTWTGPFTVPAGGRLSALLGVRVSAVPGTFYNSASASSTDFDVVPTGPTAPITVTADPLTTTKTADVSTVPVGEIGSYTITISNPNAAAVRLENVNETLPWEFTYLQGTTTLVTTADPEIFGRTLTWSGPFTVPAKGSISLHFCVTVAAVPGDYLNEAGAVPQPLFEVKPTGPTAKITVTAQPLVTAKAADRPTADVGQSAGYRITFVNPNKVPARLDAITDTLPSGFSYIGGSSSGATTANPAVAGRTLTWTGPFSVPASGSLGLGFRAIVSSVPGDYFNSASAQSPFPVTATGPTAEVTVTARPLVTTKTADVPESAVGATNGYTISVHNPNGAPVSLESIADDLPEGFSYFPGSSSPAPVVSGRSLRWTGPFTVAAGGGFSLRFGVTVAQTPGRYFNSASAAASGFAVDPTGPTAPVLVKGLTALVADPAVADLVPGAEVSFPTLRATLTDTSAQAPVAGGEVVFRAGPGHSTVVCRALTDSHGVAQCTGVIEELYAVAGLGYTAFFAGDDTYLPASDRGPLVRVAGSELP